MATNYVRILYALGLVALSLPAHAQNRGTQLDSLPIVTMDLRWICDTPNDTQAVTGSPVRVVATDQSNEASDFWIYPPSIAATPAPTDQPDARTDVMVGLRFPKILRYGDIQQLDFEIPAEACVTGMWLYINDQLLPGASINTADFPVRPGASPNNNSAPSATRVITFTREYLMLSAGQADAKAVCGLPAEISGSTLWRAIAGIIGNRIARTDDVYFEDDYVSTSLVDESNVAIRAQVHHREYGVANLDFTVGVKCGDATPTQSDPTPVGKEVTLNVSAIQVTEVNGAWSVGILDFLGEAGATDDGIGRMVSSALDSLNDLIRTSPICPPVSFQSRDGGLPSFSTGLAKGTISICN